MSLIKKTCKQLLNYAQGGYVGIARLFGSIDYPVPPNSSMRKTSSKTIKHYYTTGIETASPLATVAIQQGINLREGGNVLDFGCGVARQLLHFTRNFPEAKYFACDIDDSSIDFIQREYPQVEAYTSGFRPPLKYEDESFDLIYSVSIFSHLSMEDIPVWLEELARVTKPGGICLLTTEGKTALAPLSKSLGIAPDKLDGKLEDEGFLYKEYDHLKDSIENQNTLKVTSLLVGVEGSYGVTVLSLDHIRKNWNNEHFEVVDIIEGIIGYRQDLVVLRKKK
ncbi:MAG: class I SAM-dependent methyltransferase [Akkermansiaceae bacterium]